MRHQGPVILLCLAIAAGTARAGDDVPKLKASWKEREARVVAFSPDGTSVVSSGREGVQLRDAATGKVRATLIPRHLLKGSTFTPNSQILLGLVFSNRHQPARTLDLRVWSVADGNLLDTIPYVSEWMNENCYALSEDGKALAFVENSRRLPIQLKTFKSSRGGTPPSEVSYNNNPGLPRVRIWDVSRWEQIVMVEGREPLAFSKDGKLLATSDSDWKNQIAKLWDAKTGKLLSEFREAPPGFSHLSFSPDGRFLVIASRKEKSLREVATGRSWPIDAEDLGIPPPPNDPHFSPDGKIFFPNGIPWMDPQIVLPEKYDYFDLSEMPPKRLDLGPDRLIISKAGGWYAAVQGERQYLNLRTIVLRELSSRREIVRFNATRLGGAGPSPDGRWLALQVRLPQKLPGSDVDRDVAELRLVDSTTSRTVATIHPQEQAWGGFQWKFSPDSKSLAIIYQTGDGTFQLGEPDPTERPMNVEIWELPRH